jgi:hypothetical protein
LRKELANNGTNVKPSSINRKNETNKKGRHKEFDNFDNLCG